MAIATILNHKAGLVAPAVTAFCNRDPIDMKACRAMKYFPPENRVYSRVTFTKCLYAMLSHSQYLPDTRTGWNLPAKDSAHFKSHILGIKLACGFEILASQATPPDRLLESDTAWQQYRDQLLVKGYFQNLLEHSQEYNNLLNTAKEYFKNNRDMGQVNISNCSSALGHQVLELNRSLEHNMEHHTRPIPPDDDESWLSIDPQQLAHLLEEQYGNKTQCSPSNVVNKLNDFLETTSTIDGVEFPAPDEAYAPVRPKRGIKKNKEKPSCSAAIDNSKITLDPSNFSCAVQNILDLMIPEDSWDLESGSEMSEYEDEVEPDLDLQAKEYMEAMDRELASSSVGRAPAAGASTSVDAKPEDKFDDIESFEPVDIDMSVLRNMLESYQAQLGGPGPASTLLGPVGLHLDSAPPAHKDQPAPNTHL